MANSDRVVGNKEKHSPTTKLEHDYEEFSFKL